ncbi:hypothetical protein MMC08_003251 [Hypocenomyce scalaris]|nr:hypothetical protein [Hypocenomyce scalaris]
MAEASLRTPAANPPPDALNILSKQVPQLLQRPNIRGLRIAAFRTLRRIGYAFVPQLLRTKYFADPVPAARLYPTSNLDGLRGLAALFIFNFHFLFAYNSRVTDRPWEDTSRRGWFELPVLRLAYSGSLVTVFFVVSGYVIAAKPLRLVLYGGVGRRDNLVQTLSSSLFRRALRLYGPVAAVTLMSVVGARVGVLGWTRPYIADKSLFPGHREQQLARFPTLLEQMVFWRQEMSQLMSVWEWQPFYPVHDAHLWTIPYEFRSSLVLYLALLLVARTRRHVCGPLLFALSVYCLVSNRWELVLYLWGACIALINTLRQSKHAPVSVSDAAILPTATNGSSPKRRYRLHTHVALNFSIFLSLWLLTSPTRGFATAPGYTLLSRLIPGFYARKRGFLPTLGATLLVYCLTTSPPSSVYNRPFLNQYTQYLGRISFSLYLVHGPILHMGGYLIPGVVWTVVGQGWMAGYVGGLVVGWAANLGLALWAADVFDREVDRRCVRFARWVEELCTVE